MSFRPSGRDDPDIVTTLGVDDEQDVLAIKAEQGPPFLAIPLARVEPFDSEGIAARYGCLLKTHAMVAEVTMQQLMPS